MHVKIYRHSSFVFFIPRCVLTRILGPRGRARHAKKCQAISACPLIGQVHVGVHPELNLCTQTQTRSPALLAVSAQHSFTCYLLARMAPYPAALWSESSSFFARLKDYYLTAGSDSTATCMYRQSVFHPLPPNVAFSSPMHRLG